MFDKIKSFAKRMGNKLKFGAAVMSAAIGTAIMSVVASAEDATGGDGSSMSSVITSAGNTLKQEFSTLVTTVVPCIVSIAVVGLTIYAIIYLFRIAKKLFAKAAG